MPADFRKWGAFIAFLILGSKHGKPLKVSECKKAGSFIASQLF